MIDSTAGGSNTRTAALFAYAAGVTGTLANLFLIALFALQAGRPEDGSNLGSANDLVGSLATAFTITAALGAWLSDRRVCRIIQVVGLPAILVAGGPLERNE
ncbi:MAG: hypothetical protein ACRDTR_05730 [Rubrobacter sp.]